MHHMPLIINHNVLVVPVFNCQNVAEERVPRQRLTKSSLGLLKPSTFLFASTKLEKVVVKEGASVHELVNFVDTLGIANVFY